MKKNINIKIPNPFNLINLLVTGYVQILLMIAIFEMRLKHPLYSGFMLTLLGVLFFLYYGAYWYNQFPKVKREWVLFGGLLLGAFAYKGGINQGLIYIGIMITSGLFTENPKIFVFFEFVCALLLIGSPFNYSLSPFAFYYTESDTSFIWNAAVNFAVFIGGVWCFSYYQRVNIQLIQAQDLKEEMAKVKERERIAQDIHDAIGHALTSLNMHLEYGQNLKETDYASTQTLMNTMKAITEDAIINLKKAVAEIKDSEMNLPLSLSENLTQLHTNLKSNDGFSLIGNVPAQIDTLPEYVQKLFFVTIRELITNAIKYSGKKTLYYSFEETGEHLILLAWDTGKGAGNFKPSNGINGITEKIQALDGEIIFFDDLEKGFCMEMKLSKEFL